MNDFFEISDGKLIAYHGNESTVMIPEGITEIYANAFYRNDILRDVFIPEGVLHIGSNAFSQCQNLEKIHLPESLLSIAAGAFLFCPSLRALHLPENLKSLGALFISYTNGLKIHLPESLETIDPKAFHYARGLTVFFPASVSEIPENLFLHTTDHAMFAPSVPFDRLSPKNRLASVIGYTEAPDELLAALSKENKEKLFSYLRRYRKKIYPYIPYREALLYKLTRLRAIPYEDVDGLLEIVSGNPSFTALLLHYKNSIFTPELQQKQERLEERQLKNIFDGVPITATEMKKQWNFTKKDDGTYILHSYRGKDKEILLIPQIGKIPITEIGDYAFSPFRLHLPGEQENIRRSITSVTLPYTVTKIGTSAFFGCYALEEITLPENLTEIPDSCFYDCARLQNVHFPENLKKIGERAFAYCDRLTDLFLPDHIQFIGNEAFFECYHLTCHVKKGSVTEETIRNLSIRCVLE